MYKRTNNNLQNIHKKTKDRVTRTPLKTGGELMYEERIGKCLRQVFYPLLFVLSINQSINQSIIMNDVSVCVYVCVCESNVSVTIVAK
jgi:hypothetical protein